MRNAIAAAAVLLVLTSPVLADPPALTLADALAVALRDNPRVRNACDAVTSARYGLDVAEADFAPHLTPYAASGLGVDTETSQSTILTLGKKFTTGTAVELSA